MQNTIPISDLTSYNKVLNSVSVGNPLFLTQNGKNRFAVLDMGDYEKITSSLNLLSKLAEGENSAQQNNWISFDNAMKILEDN